VRDILATHAPPPIPEGVRREMDRIIAAFARTAGGRR